MSCTPLYDVPSKVNVAIKLKPRVGSRSTSLRSSSHIEYFPPTNGKRKFFETAIRSGGPTLRSPSTPEIPLDKRKPIRILIADNFPIFRIGLRQVLESQKDFRVVGEAADGSEAVKLALKVKPDILLLDLALPNVPGLEALRQLAMAPISCRTIILTAAIEKEETLAAIKLGARGVVLKDAPSQELVDSIRWVMSNRFWVEHNRIDDIAHAIRALESSIKEPQDLKRFGLTPREVQTIAAILSGHTNQDIAQDFSISRETVKRHLSNIFDKLGVSNRLELALFAIYHKLGPDELGLLPTPTVVSA